MTMSCKVGSIDYAALTRTEEDPIKLKQQLLREGFDALESAEVLFEKVHSGRFSGRLDTSRQELLALQDLISKQYRTKASD